MNARSLEGGSPVGQRIPSMGWRSIGVVCRGWLVLLCLWGTILAANGQALNEGAPPAESARALGVARATDVVRQWQPHQRLYVQGNLGVSAAALDGLEQWLDMHATNWVVVLVESAAGETYTDAEGDTYRGVEAVNHALGKGLMNQTAFAQQVDPRTQERNAAFFILYLKERKLSYYGSDAQDRRGLGEDHWMGRLDGPAIAAMRNGARVVDAVKDTITHIDRQLDARITAEIQARQRKAAEEEAARNRTLQQARAALENARADYSLAETKSRDLTRQFNGLTGDLARPGLPELRAELQAAETALDRSNPNQARQTAEMVRQRAQALVRLLEQYPADRQKVEELSRRLSVEKSRPYAGAAARTLESAQVAIAAAQREYERGDSSYAALMESAATALNAANTSITSAERLAAQRRLLWALALFAALAALAVIALLLNRRRLPAKTEATRLYDLWEKAFGEKTSALFALLDRRGTLVGTAAEEAAQRYTGETLRLSQQIIQDVDELFIMSSCAGRVLQQAHDLVEPAVLWPRLANWFLASRYRQAIALLRDQPIVFRPEEGLELVVRGARTERDRLIGGLTSYHPFTMTFNELIDAFNQRAQRALSALDLVASSLATAPDTLQAVQKTIAEAGAKEFEIAGAAATDNLFGLPLLFEQLLPQANQALAGALKLGISDPVGALQTDGARARQQAEDALAMVKMAGEARRKTIPAVRECATTLANEGVGTGVAPWRSEGESSAPGHLPCPPEWLERGLRQLSDQADQAVAQALRASAATNITACQQGLGQLEQRAKRAVELNQQRRTQAQQQIARSTVAIDNARREIGAALGLPAGEALREAGNDPTEYVAQAQAQWEAALATLERGDLEATQKALEAVATLTAQADAIVEASREALAAHNKTLTTIRAETQAVAARIPDHARILADIRNGYAPTVLALGAGDPSHPNANGTIADNIQETEDHLAATRALLDRAVNLHAKASVLEAAELLDQAQARLETGQHRLQEIAEKQQRLADTDTANQQQLRKLEQRGQECARLTEAPTTMMPTVRTFGEASRLLQAAGTAVQASIRDPFATAEQLATLERNLNAVADQARCDRDLHEQAGRSLAAAASQVAQAERLATQSITDQLPDSAAIARARTEVGSLASLLPVARQKHGLAHGDWHVLDQEANELSNRAAAAAALLRGELAQAQAAVAALATAASTVRAAGGWTGGFGVMIMGTPGADLLTQARGYLEGGQYELARHAAENARRLAEQAIAQAEAEMRRRRLAHEQQLEQERRRRRAEEEARQRRHSAASHWSRSSSSSSWGRSSSGARSSSFRSGSGVSTSSW